MLSDAIFLSLTIRAKKLTDRAFSSLRTLSPDRATGLAHPE
ncbi:MAG TPA: hypothetical protein V6C57_00810 [Coleofasciculaceae cyanobacterium]